MSATAFKKGQRDDKPRLCGFCGAAADMTLDDPRLRVFTCPTCGATEKLGKGRFTEPGSYQPGWYFGWTHPDGRQLRAPTSEALLKGVLGWQPTDGPGR